MRNTALITAGLLVLGLMAAPPVDAQRFPGLGGIEGRVGVALPDELDTGLAAAVDLDLGYVLMTQLRTVIGFDYWQAGVSDRAFGTQTASGSLSAVGGRLGLRLDFSDMGAMQPYGIVALTGHNVTGDGDTSDEQDLLDREFGGFVVGASVGAGLTYALNDAQTFRFVAEGRRVWSANAPHYALEVGLRIVPLGARAYEEVVRDEDSRAAVEAEELRTESERREAERRRLERERERARVDEVEAEAEVQAARRAEQERRERMTEEQRRQAELETAEARAEAERAAAARAEAEAEAAQARREAAVAREEAEAARQATRAAEERLYQSLQDLSRLMDNVTEIRATERGLSVVLGQGLFGVGQSELSPQARDEVRRIAAVLTQYPEHRISVEGHTDATGSAETNQRLSEARASAVRASLVATGIDLARVQTVGHGQRLPIADNATAQGRAQNRRVEIVILGARRPGA